MRCIKFVLLFTFLFYSNLSAQDCEELLHDGLYSFTSMTNTGSFNQDLRSYYLSENFKKDMDSGKWGASITLPLVDTILTLGMNYTDKEYTEFRTRLLKLSELKISQNNYQTVFGTIPNTNLYQAYNDCISIKYDKSRTGFISGENIITEQTAVFVIYYRPQAPSDPMPIVESFSVIPTGSVISGGLSTGQTISSFSILVTVQRHKEQDVLLALNTDRGKITSKIPSQPSLSIKDGVPIGTIIASSLNFEQFSLTTKSDENSPGSIWTSRNSRWAPCDGRSISGSQYQKISSKDYAPDLRGVFLRGVNKMDPLRETPVKIPSQLNPDNMAAGEYQEDALQTHTHNYRETPTKGVGYDEGSERKIFHERTTGTGVPIGANHGPETRPKNVSMYYYIKINY